PDYSTHARNEQNPECLHPEESRLASDCIIHSGSADMAGDPECHLTHGPQSAQSSIVEAEVGNHAPGYLREEREQAQVNKTETEGKPRQWCPAFNLRRHLQGSLGNG